MENLDNIIAENLIYLRKKAGLTQLDFGERFNYSDKTVSKWEKGAVIPNVETLKDIADFYGVSLDYLVTPHYNKKEYESVINKTAYSSNKLILVLLSVVVVFCIAVTIYVASIYNTGTINPVKNRSWVVFLWALPLSGLISTYFCNRFFKSRKLNAILLSITIWTLLSAAYITFLYKNNYWYLFFIGVPIQIALILISKLKA